MKKVIFLAAAVSLITACSSGKEETRKAGLSERARDSTIAESKHLPGAGVVKKALAVSDSASARARQIDQTP